MDKQIGNKNGITALIHDVGIYESRNTIELRKDILSRSRFIFRFINQLNLFKDVKHEQRFEMSIYSGQNCVNNPIAIFDLFHPKTIEGSIKKFHTGEYSLPFGPKNSDKAWNITPSGFRVIELNSLYLKACQGNNLTYRESQEKYNAGLVSLFDSRLVGPVFKLNKATNSQKYLEHFASMMYIEKTAQDEGHIDKKEGFASNNEKVVIGGPNILHSNPLGASCLPIVKNQLSYENIFLERTKGSSLPRTQFQKLDSSNTNKVFDPPPIFQNNELTSHSKFYRLCLRRRLNPNQERTLIPCIIPPGWSHVHSLISCSFKTSADLLWACGLTLSLPIDFKYRSSAKVDFLAPDFKDLLSIKKPENLQILDMVCSRVLLLSCVTNQHKSLWEDNWSTKDFKWIGQRNNFKEYVFINSWTQEWNSETRLLSDLGRRQACIEIDVLVAISFGIDLDEMIAMYETFSVSKMYEESSKYDLNGVLVETVNKQIKKRTIANSLSQQTNSEYKTSYETSAFGPTEEIEIIFNKPFSRINRIADYKEIYEKLSKVIK